MRRRQLSKRNLEGAIHNQALAPGAPDLLTRNATGRRQRDELVRPLGAQRDHRPGGRLAEQPGERVAGESDPATDLSPQARFGQRHGQPAVRHIVCRGQQAVCACPSQQLG